MRIATVIAGIRKLLGFDETKKYYRVLFSNGRDSTYRFSIKCDEDHIFKSFLKIVQQKNNIHHARQMLDSKE